MPSLRVHFNADDLARTRTAPGPDPLWELVLSVTILRSRQVTTTRQGPAVLHALTPMGSALLTA